MTRMLAFLRRRCVPDCCSGFLLLALFIWYAGPYFAFADYRPLEPHHARLIAIRVLIVAVWAAWQAR